MILLWKLKDCHVIVVLLVLNNNTFTELLLLKLLVTSTVRIILLCFINKELGVKILTKHDKQSN